MNINKNIQPIQIEFIIDNTGRYDGINYYLNTEKGIQQVWELSVKSSILDLMKMIIKYLKVKDAFQSVTLGDDFSSMQDVLMFNNEDKLIYSSNKLIYNSNEELKQNLIDITVNNKEDWINYFNTIFGEVHNDKEKAIEIVNEFNNLCEELLKI